MFILLLDRGKSMDEGRFGKWVSGIMGNGLVYTVFFWDAVGPE